jgi:hypothetical protein
VCPVSADETSVSQAKARNHRGNYPIPFGISTPAPARTGEEASANGISQGYSRYSSLIRHDNSSVMTFFLSTADNLDVCNEVAFCGWQVRCPWLLPARPHPATLNPAKMARLLLSGQRQRSLSTPSCIGLHKAEMPFFLGRAPRGAAEAEARLGGISAHLARQCADRPLMAPLSCCGSRNVQGMPRIQGSACA